MHAIQFRTYAKHGTIKIPEPYQEWQNRELTVILLIPEETSQRQQRFFESVKKHTFKLPRITVLTVRNSMRDKVFLDTNLWFYLYSDDDKSTRVADLIKTEFDHIILSTQVQGELFNAITRKQLKTATEAAELIAELRTTGLILGVLTGGA